MAGLTIRGPHTNVRGPFSHTRTQDFLSRVHFSFPKKLTTFFSRQRERQQSVVKIGS